MPTNLPAEARARWLKYLEARTREEKLRALQEFLSAVPKHKGTENLRAWARRKIAELREEIEERRARRSGRGPPSFFIEKEGAAQVVIIGYPNAGKSSLLKALTNARVAVSEVPFTTKYPVPGMLKFEDIQFQLVEAPAVIKGASQGAIWWGSRVMGLARNSDVLLIVVDLTSEPLNQLESIINELDESGIVLSKPRGYVKISRSKAIHGLKVIVYGRVVDSSITDVKNLLKSYGIRNAEVKIYGDVSINDVEKAIFERLTYRPGIVILNKADLVPSSYSNAISSKVRRRLSLECVITSALKGWGLESIPRLLFKVSNIIRVYTKEPNSSKPSPKPLALPKGSRVEDALKELREELLKYFRYARVWGPSAKYPGERVGLEHVLDDGDVIEVRTTIKGV